MKSFFALVPLFLLLLILSTANARKDVGEYWKGDMKGQPMPEAIKELLQTASTSFASNEKTDCHEYDVSIYHDDVGLQEKNILHERSSEKEFEPRPDVSIYHKDETLEASKPLIERSFIKDQEPVSAATIYHNDVTLEVLEPRPDVRIYHDNTFFKQELESRPDVSIYHNDVGAK
ncbi:hypothetical protein GH714_008436 [Hevea brasiliensis]|uniref:Organ-specific protein S2 n=1 Tax=Hevea brasiliensis TaxID=3981 RepID=A0A6A6MYG2_HEVBR|nr:hypothetical protein GH714_008436 [Hevea brasiliensis]